MRSIEDYLQRAAEFEALAVATDADEVRKRYLDIAAGYHLLAKEREWLVETGAMEGGDRSAMPPARA